MNAVIQFHPMFPLRGTRLEKEAFVELYKGKLAAIRLKNEEMKRSRTVGTKRITELVNDSVHVSAKVHSVCQAFNLNSSPCKFKATCGRFCKKHQVSANDLELVD
jgi:methyl coenzyme M reductase subunit D